MADDDKDDWCDRCFVVDPQVRELRGELAKFRALLRMMNGAYRSLRERRQRDREALEEATRQLAKLQQVMGFGERMGHPDEVTMKEIRQVLRHG